MFTFRTQLLLATLLLLNYTLAAAQKKPNDAEIIRNIMQKQQADWNRADIEAFMEGYWKSDSLKFIGRNGITYGWTTTLENYKKGYPTPEAMGQLTFTLLSVEILSPTTAFVIGKWELKRTHDNPGGHFTLLWKKIKGKWVIVADHTS
ncbi:MAG: nuclear transport factor 2 family protein [Flammeovirgaceae bacterium]|nr:MAG: nuclear transport factor 2 family protein [Flammeovirgaceae bacterium]